MLTKTNWANARVRTPNPGPGRLRPNRLARLWRALKAMDAAIHCEPADMLTAQTQALAARLSALEGAVPANAAAAPQRQAKEN